ncbi:MAG TPA: divergent polysaccharide deacetylase family protein [Armatimonadota bacterium]
MIDDIGSSASGLERFLDIDAPLTFSIIPDTREATRCLSLIKERGRTAMAHLPMEPLDRSKASANCLTVDTVDPDIRSRVSRWLGKLPGIAGANNHMGSRATQDERVMRDVLQEMRDRDLFFLDSRTADRTVVSAVADELGVPHLARDGRFLDDGGRTGDTYDIVLELGEIARRQGHAIGIGHPHAGTARAIARALPELAARGVRIVPITDLLK